MALDAHELQRPPGARAAYSHRTAWLMAELARLAYIRFELGPARRQQLVQRLAELDTAEGVDAALDAIVAELTQGDDDGRRRLETALAEGGFELVTTFDQSGTQGFVARRARDGVAVLAFRGTETDFEDIRTDLQARFYRTDGVRIHSGFYKAYSAVAAQVEAAVTECAEDRLYVTGHSLGGALAVVAARQLESDGLAACYTFGSPRVGDLDFGDGLRTPVYRLVNAADLVPRLPPVWLLQIVVLAARCVPVPYLRATLVNLAEQLRGYRHHGDLRYIPPTQEDVDRVRILANPDLIRRGLWLIQRLSRDWSAGVRDHRIDSYCRKVARYVQQAGER
ncbi:MAG: lipase family protein [Ectothiorhodospiraceae bacterium]